MLYKGSCHCGNMMRSLPQSSYAIFGARDYVASHPEAATEARYQLCRWIGFDDTRGRSESFDWLCNRIGRVPEIRCSNASTILNALLTGAGLAVLPCFIAAEEPSLMQLTAPIDDVRLVADRIAALFQRYRHQLQPEGAG